MEEKTEIVELEAFGFDGAHYSFLKKNKIPVGAIFILECIIKNRVIPEGGMDDLQWLQRKGYIALSGLAATLAGEELYCIMFEDNVPAKPAKKAATVKNDDFETWWDIFPATNGFEINGREFKGVRALRQKKEECRRKFFELTQKFKVEEIIGATKVHFQLAKEISWKKGENQLTYIPNSERYLRERVFEPYISKIGKKEEKTDLTVDI